ncbi:hypothetical protein ATANTOWER_005114 [Ataeniobius toweri]|uniref:Uncharacterized protein n=1 Tax=Ataeniobius toweri TaxID=208326 RepID=A0ABU7BZY8_9TELE|nr:hypothetical protein [Ataeniobius toweri]
MREQSSVQQNRLVQREQGLSMKIVHNTPRLLLDTFHFFFYSLLQPVYYPPPPSLFVSTCLHSAKEGCHLQ